MLFVSNSTIEKSCAAQESLCKQRIYRKCPRYFSGTILDRSQNVMEDVSNIPSTSLYKHFCVHSVWLTKGNTSLVWADVLSFEHLATDAKNFWFWYIKTCLVTVSVVLGCVPASEIGITFLLLEMENVTVLYTGPLLLPCVCPGEVPRGSVVYAAVELAESAAEGWWVRPMIVQVQEKKSVQSDLGTGAGKSVWTLLLLVWGDSCYESVPGPLLRLIFQGMLARWETLHLFRF